MNGAAPVQRMSAAAYLEWERQQSSKHEFHRGEVFAMAGGSPRHNFLSAAVAAELRSAVRDHGCIVLSSDQRISADEGHRYVYADAVVVCGGVRTEAGTTDVLCNPSIVVEVLSSGTEAYDRAGKWASYQRLPSLTDYLLVGQSQIRVEHYRRDADGAWRYEAFGPGGNIRLSGDIMLSVDAVYADAFAVPSDGDDLDRSVGSPRG